MQRTCDVFELACFNCQRTVEFPARAVVETLAHCPLCGAPLDIRWRDASPLVATAQSP